MVATLLLQELYKDALLTKAQLWLKDLIQSQMLSSEDRTSSPDRSMEPLHESDNCPICMSPMGPYVSQEDEIAVLPCQHCYHNNCLAEWIQTATSCPYCRCEFASVTIVHEAKGPIIRSYTVEPKLQEEQIPDGEEEEYIENGEVVGTLGRNSASACLICGSHEREDILMLCEFCDDPYHSFCLGAEELPQEAFCCPICTTNGERIANLPEHATLRTVEGRRRSRRTRRSRESRRSTNRQVQYDTWRAAWERVASRAWSRLNAGLEYQVEVEPTLTRQQEDELRHWRTRVERRATPNTVITDIPDASEQAVMDPQTASLWAAFEQARNFSKSPGPTNSSKNTAQAEAGPLMGTSEPEVPTSQPKQKRPRASVKRKAADDIESPQKVPRARSSSVTADHPLQTGFLSSLLKNIKDSGKDSRPLSYKSLKSQSSPCHRTRPSSPSNMSSSADSEGSLSRPQSPASDATPLRQYNKTELSRLVSIQLKPLYHVKLTKDEFTNINRTVTRRIFDDPLLLTRNEFDVKCRIEQEIRHELNDILVPWD